MPRMLAELEEKMNLIAVNSCVIETAVFVTFLQLNLVLRIVVFDPLYLPTAFPLQELHRSLPSTTYVSLFFLWFVHSPFVVSSWKDFF